MSEQLPADELTTDLYDGSPDDYMALVGMVRNMGTDWIRRALAEIEDNFNE